jgi:hypothetical protein
MIRKGLSFTGRKLAPSTLTRINPLLRDDYVIVTSFCQTVGARRF